jgi:pimeloyl-ACP methyl ester carboxylesterase
MVPAIRHQGAALGAQFGGRFDVVSWDLRGTGASTHVSCFHNARSRARFWRRARVPTTRRAGAAYIRRTARFARRCGELNGKLLAHLSTADTVRDLDYLRRLVGDRRLNFVGQSAGSYIGQTYANVFPNRVRAMVLDGVVDPVFWSAGTASAVQKVLAAFADPAFAKFESVCQDAGPTGCGLAGPEPVATRVSALLAQLRRAPLPAPSSTPPGNLTYGDALTAIVTQGIPADWPALATALDAAANGDGSLLETRAREVLAHFVQARTSEGVIALVCADSPGRQPASAWRRVVARLTASSHLAGPVLAWWRWAPCASWPSRSANRYAGPWNASTPHPILVIGTRFDPTTPYSAAKRAARRLGNAVLLTHDGYGHTSSADPSLCVQRATAAYLTNLLTPPPGAVCQSDQQPFDPGFG